MNLVISDVRLSFWQYLLLSLRFTFQTRPFLLVMLLPILGSIVAVCLSIVNGQPLSDLWHEVPFAVLFSVAFPFLIIWPTWRQYQQSTFLQEAVTYTLSEDGVQVVAPSFRTVADWQAIVQLRHFGNWLLLQTSAQTAFFLDLRQVQPPATALDVLDFLRQAS